MSKPWRSILLSLSAVTLLFTACKKKSSTDAPLPVQYNPSIIIGSDNYVVYALDPVTGSKNWELSLYGPIKACPLVYGGMVYIGTTNSDTLYKVNSRTGVVVQKILADSDPNAYFTIQATPIADNGLVYLAGYDNSKLYAIDTGTGKTKWYYATQDGNPIYSSPVIYNSKIYFATTGGSIYCLDKTNGGTLAAAPFTVTPEIWTLTIPGASFMSSPAVGAPYLYIGSTIDSNMYCIYLDIPAALSPSTTGIVRWSYKTHGAINSSPSAANGRCIFGSADFKVYCLDTSINTLMGQTSPDSIWVTHTGSSVLSSPYVVNQVVYVGSQDDYLYALNIIDGHVKWQFHTSGTVNSSPVVYNGLVYVGSYDKNLYAIDSSLGTLKWKQPINGIIECSPAIENYTGAQINSQVSGLTN